MGDDTISRNGRNEFLFHHLVAMFQTLALQQLGKLVNPITGQLERDLQQAKITIDMLQMLKERTAGNLEQSEQMILDRALLELQMNFVDESKRADEGLPPEGEDSSGGVAPDAEHSDDGAPETEATESLENEGVDAGEDAAEEKQSKKKKKSG